MVAPPDPPRYKDADAEEALNPGPSPQRGGLQGTASVEEVARLSLVNSGGRPDDLPRRPMWAGSVGAQKTHQERRKAAAGMGGRDLVTP